jgi:hypothetical protein
MVATSLEAKGAIILELRQELKRIGECTYGGANTLRWTKNGGCGVHDIMSIV